MSAPARPADCAVLLLADKEGRRIALARREGRLLAPLAFLERGDGDAAVNAPPVTRKHLGAPEHRAAAFQDAALRALYEELGQLIARPAYPAPQGPLHGGWERLARHRLAPDRSALTCLGRAIDPAEWPERRHVRVFTAPLSRVSNSIKRRGRAEKTVWMTPADAAEALDDPALEPFPELCFQAMGARFRPLMTSFRLGQRRLSRI